MNRDVPVPVFNDNVQTAMQMKPTRVSVWEWERRGPTRPDIRRLCQGKERENKNVFTCLDKRYALSESLSYPWKVLVSAQCILRYTVDVCAHACIWVYGLYECTPLCMYLSVCVQCVYYMSVCMCVCVCGGGAARGCMCFLNTHTPERACVLPPHSLALSSDRTIRKSLLMSGQRCVCVSHICDTLAHTFAIGCRTRTKWGQET